MYASISRKRQEIRPQLLLMTNRKLHIRFLLAPRSMTLHSSPRSQGERRTRPVHLKPSSWPIIVSNLIAINTDFPTRHDQASDVII